MVIVSPQGLWDNFQMAELHGLQMGVTNPYTLHETNSSPPKIDGCMKFPCQKAYFFMGVILTTY